LVALLAVAETAVPAADALGDRFPLFADGGFFAPLCVPGPALLPGVTLEAGVCEDGAVETWVCEDPPPALVPVMVGAVLAGAEVMDGEFGGVVVAGAGFADAEPGVGVDAAVSVAAVVASRSAAKGSEFVSGAGAAGVADHCGWANDDAELTSDAILDTAWPMKDEGWQLACNRRASGRHLTIHVNSIC
jgi:hypothetical protein